MGSSGFIFPGQGAQHVGMGREVAESLPAANQLFQRASTLLGYDLAHLCWEGPESRLNTTEFSQPALFVSSMASLAKLRETKPDALVSCTYTAGLSLGEYSALCFADVLDFEDALRVVSVRGQAMQRAADLHPGGMVAILGLELANITELCDQARQASGELEVANLLCPGNIVCSGDKASCEALAQLAVQSGAMKVIPLAVAGAFHTHLMQGAVTELATVLAEVPLRTARIPVVSNVDAKPHTDPEEIRDLLVRQIVSPVHWEDSVRTMLAAGVEEFYEIGAGTVLRGLMKRIDRKFPFTNI